MKQWGAVAFLILQFFIELWKEHLALKNGEVALVETIRRKQLELLDAISRKDSRIISVRAYQRGMRLRAILDGLKNDNEKA